MEKRIQLKAVICGVALAALVSARPALSQECTPPSNDCGESEEEPCPITCTFSPDQPTQKFDFGTGHFIKITANVVRSFDLTVDFITINPDPSPNPDLDDRLNIGLGPANCIPYDGATANNSLGSCGYYHVVNDPLPIKGDPGCTDCDYSGDVLYKVFWDFPTLDQLNNVRLYRAPIPAEDAETCSNLSDCFTQDITGTVYAVGASGNPDPGTGGKGKGFSDYEVVDLTSPTSPAARVWIGLRKLNDAGILFDLKAVVKKNGSQVSSGELLGAPGGGKGFGNANLLTIPLSLPADAFVLGNNISIKLFVRNSCLASPQNFGTARLWYNDTFANSRVNEPGAPTLYLVRGDDDGEQDFDDHGDDGGALSMSPGNGPKKKKNVRVNAPVPSCDGPYRSFEKWSGTVPN